MLDDTLNLLTDVHHGAKMGVESIDALIKAADTKEMKDKLLHTQNEYKKFAGDADSAIQKRGEIPKEIGVMSKIIAHGMVGMSAAFDPSDKKQAQMLIKGFEMANDELSRSLQKNEHADESAKQMAFELLRMQQREIKNFNDYFKS